MIGFINICPETIIRACEVKQCNTGTKPKIKLSQASYDILKWNENTNFKHPIINGYFREYEVVIDDSMEFGMCEIIKGENKGE